MDKFKNMTIFTAIADQGSMSAAADQLDRSVATITRGLAELEEYLGVRLINRSTRSLSLTDEGLVYLKDCRRILAELSEVESQLDHRKLIPTGTLSITAPVTFGRLHLAPLLYQWLSKNEGLRADLILLDRTVDLLEEGFDLALRIGQLEESSLVAIPIGDVTEVCCASPDFLRQRGEPNHPTQLTQWPAITFAQDGQHWRFLIEGQVRRIKVRSVLTCNQIDPIIEAARNGLGIACLRSYQVAQYCKADDLVPVLSDFRPLKAPVQFVFPHSRLLSPRVRTFVEWAVPQLRNKMIDAE